MEWFHFLAIYQSWGFCQYFSDSCGLCLIKVTDYLWARLQPLEYDVILVCGKLVKHFTGSCKTSFVK